MKQITVLCTDPLHPVNMWLDKWVQRVSGQAEVRVCRDRSELLGGDFLFLVSCQQMIRAEERRRYAFALVLHASALPRYRGMSPHVWQILDGAQQLTVTLLSAEDEVDSGDIWQQATVDLDGTELYDQINEVLFDAELKLMDWALENCGIEAPRKQVGVPTYMRRRTPEDSRIDPHLSIAEVFDLMRVCDPARYPAYFDLRGKRYRITVEKMEVPK